MMRPEVSILTGGGDRPYALGLASSLVDEGVSFDFISSDYLESPQLSASSQVRVLNLRGDMSPEAPAWRKVVRVARYYVRLLAYALTAKSPVFHILWNNKVEFFDRTILLLYYRLLGKRLVMTVHNVNARTRDGNDSALNRMTLGIQYRLVDHLFVHTQLMKNEMNEQFGVPPGKVTVIPFGINSTVPNTELTRAQARDRLGLAPSDRVVLFFGNIAPYKGLEYLVQAVASVVESAPDLRLVIAGRPKCTEQYWAALQRLLATPRLHGKIIERIEYVSDADTEIYFKAADVLALPYTHVFQSGVLFLGYNFGLPVIVSDVASLKEDIIEGQTGFACRPADPADLAAAIQRYFASDLFSEIDSRRAKIHQFASGRYSWKTVAAISASTYRSLLSAK